MDIIIHPINQLIDDAKNDEEFRQWFQSVDAYTHSCCWNPDTFLSRRAIRKDVRSATPADAFYNEKYKSHFDRLFDSIGTWFSSMGEDPLNKRFGDDWARLTRDLLFDSEGSLKFKPELWTDIRRLSCRQLLIVYAMFAPIRY